MYHPFTSKDLGSKPDTRREGVLMQFILTEIKYVSDSFLGNKKPPKDRSLCTNFFLLLLRHLQGQAETWQLTRWQRNHLSKKAWPASGGWNDCQDINPLIVTKGNIDKLPPAKETKWCFQLKWILYRFSILLQGCSLGPECNWDALTTQSDNFPRNTCTHEHRPAFKSQYILYLHIH